MLRGDLNTFRLVVSTCSLAVLTLLSACHVPVVPPTEKHCVPSAHRGEHSVAPDNSEQAIRSAVAHGIPFIEIDVRQVISGHLLLFHDRKLTVTNSLAPETLLDRNVEALTHEELRTVRNPDGSPLLLLEDALKIIQGSASIVQLDVKPDAPAVLDNVFATLDRLPKAKANIVIQCQHIECVEYINRRADNVRILARVFSREEFKAAHRFRPYIIQLDEEILNAEIIETAHRDNSKILIKTLGAPPDTSKSWQRLCNAGVDIILTDHPLQFSKSLELLDAR